MTFGTDPATLSQEQLVAYVRQLQQTVLFWQANYVRMVARIPAPSPLQQARSAMYRAWIESIPNDYSV